MVDLLGERERGKAKEIQHRAGEREKAQSAPGRLVQSTSCRFGFVQQATPGENAPGVWRFRRSDKDFRCYQAGAERARWALGWCPEGHCPAQNGCFALCFP